MFPVYLCSVAVRAASIDVDTCFVPLPSSAVATARYSLNCPASSSSSAINNPLSDATNNENRQSLSAPVPWRPFNLLYARFLRQLR